MKKFFAILLALAVLFAFAACGSTQAPAKTPETTAAPETTAPEATEPAVPIGTLYVSFSGTMELTYDKDGNALEIKGTNEVGETLATAAQNQVGKGCVFALRSILRNASDNNLLGDAKSMAVRVGAGDPLPKENFLEEIQTDCQYLADEECTGIQMKILHGDKLDAQGNLTLDTAKMLAARHLDVKPEELTGADAPVDGAYTFTCGDKSCTVDVFSGMVVTV